MRSGSSRPTPATSQTGVPLWRATAAAARDPLTARNSAGATAPASRITRSASAAAAPSPARGTSTASTSACTSRCTRPEPSWCTSTTSTSTSPRRGRASVANSGQPSTQHGGVVGQGVGELAVGAVALELVEGAADLGSRVAGGEHPGAQPHQRRRAGLARHQPTAGGDQALGVVGERRQGPGGLAHHHRLGVAGGPGHVAESLDGVHHRLTLPRWGRSAGRQARATGRA